MTKHDFPYNPAAMFANFQPMSMFGNTLLDSASHGGESYAKAWLAWQSELIAFTARRLQWDSKVAQALAACKTPTEVMEVQRDWMAASMKDYIAESGRLMELATKLAPTWLTPFGAHSEPTPKDNDGRRSA